MQSKPSLSAVWIALGGDVVPKEYGTTKTKCILPGHPDRNASATVNEEKGTWKCYTCGEYGDVYAIVMQVEGLAFPQAKRRAHEITGSEGRDERSNRPSYLGGKRELRRYVPSWLKR